MKCLFRRTRWWQKALCLFLSFAFLSLTVSCSHSPNKSTGQQEARSGSFSVGEAQTAKSNSGEDPWWKKPEYEWMIATLIVIGVGIAAGAAIMISSGAGGLSVRVQK
jgi:hypothetical protein